MKRQVEKSNKANSYERNGRKDRIVKLAFKRGFEAKKQTLLNIGKRDK